VSVLVKNADKISPAVKALLVPPASATTPAATAAPAPVPNTAPPAPH
jgi:hypothetical protein